MTGSEVFTVSDGTGLGVDHGECSGSVELDQDAVHLPDVPRFLAAVPTGLVFCARVLPTDESVGYLQPSLRDLVLEVVEGHWAPLALRCRVDGV